MPPEVYDFLKIEAASENKTMTAYFIEALLVKSKANGIKIKKRARKRNDR